MATKSVKSLSKQLAGVAKQAKSLGINTSKADAMVKQTKREGSKSFSGSSEEKAYNDSIITSQNLTPNTPINIPEPKVTDVPDYLANYVGLTGGETGMSVSGSTLSVDPVKDTATSDPYAGIMQAFLDNNKSIEDNRTTAEEIQRKVEKESGIKKYREEANNLSGQLNTITASRDAAVLSLEGQGRGQTAGFIGGEQARINREAAIKALPIQAQLATAQGNVALAQDHINTWGKILMDDATNEYNNQKATNLSIFSYLNDAEKRRLDVIQKADDRAYAEQTNNINYQRSLASEAASYGLGGVSASILKLDPKSATFNQDIAGLQSRVMKPVAPVDTTPKVVSVNGVDSVWNPTTKQFEAITVGGDSGLKTIKDAEIKDLSETWTAKNSVLSLVDSLQKNIKENGTQNLFGKTSGERTGDTTNLLLAMKNLEKTGALDAGTIKVLEGTIPSSKFFATEAAQIASLQSIKDTIESKVNEYVGSYRGTSAETDPRTKRIYGATTFDNSLFQPNEVDEIYNMFGVSNSTSSGAFNADQWLQ